MASKPPKLAPTLATPSGLALPAPRHAAALRTDLGPPVALTAGGTVLRLVVPLSAAMARIRTGPRPAHSAPPQPAR